MSGSMRCARCRQRVSQIISKMTGLREYTVDVLNKQVTFKGEFKTHLRGEEVKDFESSVSNDRRRLPLLKLFLRSFVAKCFTNNVAD
ncbi:hypothetical protein Tsubulata_036339 [Turnera subulata]|uniref:HMA domain-containing protein n=1 Tax=Turnera subulata TaxID=218843 RepID=A0A9Q0JAI9_9ROSI|nr:hypothetical protein Tsubulata_036339 [Turnera subulata]